MTDEASRSAKYRDSMRAKIDTIALATEVSMHKLGFEADGAGGWRPRQETKMEAGPQRKDAWKPTNISFTAAEHLPAPVWTMDHDQAVRLAAIEALHLPVTLGEPKTRKARRAARKIAQFKVGDLVCMTCSQHYPCDTARIAQSRR